VLLLGLDGTTISTPLVLAQQETVALETKPETIQLPLAATTPVLIVIHNRTPNSLQQIGLSWYTDANIDIIVNEPVRLENLTTQGDYAWTVLISERKSGERRTGTIQWRIDYNITETTGTATTVPKVAFATLTVTLAQTITIIDPKYWTAR